MSTFLARRIAWEVWRSDVTPSDRPGIRRVSPRHLGRVMAVDYARALARAWTKWPHERDRSQVQDGFSIRKAVR